MPKETGDTGIEAGIRSRLRDLIPGLRFPVGATTARPPGPEPAALYGYVALVDPETGGPHLLADPNSDSVAGYPERLTVVFADDAGQTRDVTVAGAEAFEDVRATGADEPAPADMALRYFIKLIHEDSEPGEPQRFASGEARCAIRYNPAIWHFQALRADPYIYPDPNGELTRGSNRFSRIDLQPRTEPFPEFPPLDDTGRPQT